MSRKCSLTTQTGKIFLVIRKNKIIDENLIKQYLKEYALDYAFIKHEKDIEPVTGIVEGVHYHIVYNGKDKRLRLSTILNNVVEFFGFKDANGIEIEKYTSFELSIQYLIHKNNPEKTRHLPEEIVSNIDKDLLNTYLTCDIEVMSFDYIYSLCNSNSNILGVIKSLGLSAFHSKRSTIWDIWNAVQEEKKRLTFNEQQKDYQKGFFETIE